MDGEENLLRNGNGAVLVLLRVLADLPAVGTYLNQFWAASLIGTESASRSQLSASLMSFCYRLREMSVRWQDNAIRLSETKKNSTHAEQLIGRVW